MTTSGATRAASPTSPSSSPRRCAFRLPLAANTAALFHKRTIRDADVRGKRVLVRVDFNVPLANGAVADDTRIRAALPTIEELRSRGAKLILVSHLGRPKGREPELSLRPVAERLGELIGEEVVLAPGVVGEEVTELADGLEPGDVLL